ncbi:prostaglandin-E synthase [Sarracenia purpurea var. burkii]
MRRASTLASSALHRALLPAHDGFAAAALQQRLAHVALYGTTNTSGGGISSSPRRPWFYGALGSISGSSTRAVSVGLAGALFTVVGATSLFQEAYAKERPPPELVPNEVILYQYEACPFCNKVKDKKPSGFEGDLDCELLRGILIRVRSSQHPA